MLRRAASCCVAHLADGACADARHFEQADTRESRDSIVRRERKLEARELARLTATHAAAAAAAEAAAAAAAAADAAAPSGGGDVPMPATGVAAAAGAASHAAALPAEADARVAPARVAFAFGAKPRAGVAARPRPALSFAAPADDDG